MSYCPLYHLTPIKGWMNDPNGLCHYDGLYRLFYQHYPHKTEWGTTHWGYVVSEDLYHFEDRGIALYPDKPYEKELGRFSGSAYPKGKARKIRIEGDIHIEKLRISYLKSK